MDSAARNRRKPFSIQTKRKQKSLAKLVKKKDLKNLKKLGGIDEVARVLRTDIRKGISNDGREIARRRRAFGSNSYRNRSKHVRFLNFIWRLPSKDYNRRVWQSLHRFTVYKDLVSIIATYILFYAALVVGIRRVPYRKFTQLRNRDVTRIDVVRDGRKQRICTSEIVVGDVICLKTEDQVPADGLLLEAEGGSLFVDASSLTADSQEVEINHDQNPFLFSGSEVVGGSGRMLVISVGKSTLRGDKKSQNSPDEHTPLQEKLDQLCSLIRKVWLANALIFIVALLARYFTGNTKDEYGNQEFKSGDDIFADGWNATVAIFIEAFVVIVMFAIPEGLRLAVGLIVSFSEMRMMADMELTVSDSSAWEKMASATTICMSITGNDLTMNQVKVDKFWLGNVSLDKGAYSSVARCVKDLLQEGITGLYVTCGTECGISGIATEKAIVSWAIQELNMDMDKVTKRCTIHPVDAFDALETRSVLIKRKADKTEHTHWKGAANIILAKCSRYYDTFGRIQVLDDNQKLEFQRIIEYMAESSIQCIGFAYSPVPAQEEEEEQNGEEEEEEEGEEEEEWEEEEEEDEEEEDSDGNETLKEDGLVPLGLMGEEGEEEVEEEEEEDEQEGNGTLKADGQVLLGLMGQEGEQGVKEEEEEEEGNGTLKEDGQVLLGLMGEEGEEGEKEKEEDSGGNETPKEDGLVLLGLVGIVKDPCRKDVECCQNAGIKVKMITGDNVSTEEAIDIARECGILHPRQDVKEAVIDGEKFRNYSPKQRREKVNEICLMVRPSDKDKLRFVQSLKQKGHVVAVTGSDESDVLALTAADIGLFLGNPGDEVAKNASKIVILDDNFASVTTVVKWSRCIYNSIRKFIQFYLTFSIAALAINFTSAALVGEIPLNSAHLLWLFLILHAPSALALATEKPTKELMEKPPVGKTEPLVSKIMWSNLLAQVLFQSVVVLVLLLKAGLLFGEDYLLKGTFIFNAILLYQVFNQFNARKLEKKNVFVRLYGDTSFLFIIVVIIWVQILMVQFLKPFENSTSLNWEQWAACYGIAFMSWPIGWFVKWICSKMGSKQRARNVKGNAKKKGEEILEVKVE